MLTIRLGRPRGTVWRNFNKRGNSARVQQMTWCGAQDVSSWPIVLKKSVVARGEALAAHLLASAAIRAALAIISNREEGLAKMSAFIDETLNMSGPGRVDAHDELNTQMRETARFQAKQSLDAIARMFRNPPARG